MGVWRKERGTIGVSAMDEKAGIVGGSKMKVAPVGSLIISATSHEMTLTESITSTSGCVEVSGRS
jgi:hypothetical protein